MVLTVVELFRGVREEQVCRLQRPRIRIWELLWWVRMAAETGSCMTSDCQYFLWESIAEAGLLKKKRFGVKFQPNILSATHSNPGLSYSYCE